MRKKTRTLGFPRRRSPPCPPAGLRANRQTAAQSGMAPLPEPDCFYAPALDIDEKPRFARAVNLTGLDDEIALLRVKVLTSLHNDPQNLKPALECIKMIGRLSQVRVTLKNGKRKVGAEDIRKLLEEFTLPLGISILPQHQNQP